MKSKNVLKGLFSLSIIAGVSAVSIAASCNSVVPIGDNSKKTDKDTLETNNKITEMVVEKDNKKSESPKVEKPDSDKTVADPVVVVPKNVPETEADAKVREDLSKLLKEIQIVYLGAYKTKISSFDKTKIVFVDLDTEKYVPEIKNVVIDKKNMSANVSFVFKYKANQTIVSEQKSFVVRGFLPDTIIDNRSEIQKELEKVEVTYKNIENTLISSYNKSNVIFSGFNNEKYVAKIVKERVMPFEASGFVDVTYVLENKTNINEKSIEKTKRIFDFKLIENYDYDNPDDLSENFILTKGSFPDVSNILLVDFDPSTIVFTGFDETKYKINIFKVVRRIEKNDIEVEYTLSTLDDSRETVTSKVFTKGFKVPINEKEKDLQSTVDGVITDYENRENLWTAEFEYRLVKYSNFDKKKFTAVYDRSLPFPDEGYIELTFHLSTKDGLMKTPERTVRLKGFKKTVFS